MAENLNVKKERQANIELLRILAMFMIVVMHLLGSVLAKIEFGGVPYLVLWFVSTLSHPADACFVLISAYFLADQPFRASRLLRIWLIAMFYAILGALIGFAVFHMPLSRIALLQTFFPITSNAYWFLTQYMLLVAVSPLLNRLIGSLSRAAHARAVVLLAVLFSVIPTVLFWSQEYFSDGWDLAWFVLIYFVGAYLRRYEVDIPRPGIWYVVCCIFLTLSRLILGKIVIHYTGSAHGAGLFYRACSPFFPFMAVCLLSMFRRLKVGCVAQWINRAASCAIGVYLLHTNRFLSPQFHSIADLDQIDGTVSVLLRALWIALLVFFLGLGTEALRRQLAKLCRQKELCRWFDGKAEAFSARILPADADREP